MSSSKPGDETARAVTLTSRYLRAGVRSVREVRAYLQHRTVSDPVIQHVLQRLHAQGVLDDQACARLWATHWAERGFGSAAIQSKLSAKGLADSLIHEVLRQLHETTPEVVRAHRLAAQLARQRHGPAAVSQRSHLARRLAARGFDEAVIAQVLSETFGPVPSDAEQ